MRTAELKFLTLMQSGEAITAECITVEGTYPVFGGNGLRGFTEQKTHTLEAPLIGRQGALCGNVNYANGDFYASEHAIVAAPRAGVHPRWLYWMLQELGLNRYSMAAAQPGLSVEVLERIKVAWPEMTLQERIANFLDDKTARIDALIAEKERLAGVLIELHTEAIDHAVLGSDIQRKGAALRGLEILGPIPESWTTSRMKFEIDYVTSGSRGWADFYTDEGALFVRIGNLTRNSIDLDLSDIQRVTLPDAAEGVRARVLQGDLLISITAYLGSIAVAPEDINEAYVSQHVALARPNLQRVLPEWLGYVVLSSIGRTFFELQAYGGTKIQLSLEDIRELPVPLPDKKTQVDRLVQLKKRLTHISQLSAHAKEHIARLREYRSSLISAAVTGQLELQ